MSHWITRSVLTALHAWWHVPECLRIRYPRARFQTIWHFSRYACYFSIQIFTTAMRRHRIFVVLMCVSLRDASRFLASLLCLPRCLGSRYLFNENLRYKNSAISRCHYLYKLSLKRMFCTNINILIYFYFNTFFFIAICVIDHLKQLIFRNANISLLHPISRIGHEKYARDLN